MIILYTVTVAMFFDQSKFKRQFFKDTLKNNHTKFGCIWQSGLRQDFMKFFDFFETVKKSKKKCHKGQ